MAGHGRYSGTKPKWQVCQDARECVADINIFLPLYWQVYQEAKECSVEPETRQRIKMIDPEGSEQAKTGSLTLSRWIGIHSTLCHGQINNRR